MGVNFLGELALDPQVRIGGDTGSPVTTNRDSKHAEPFIELAVRIDEGCRQTQSKGPSLTIED